MCYIRLTALLLLPACGGVTGPEIDVTGIWVGSYTAPTLLLPSVTYNGVIEFVQSGSKIAGNLTTNAERSAIISGSISGTRITATFTYMDTCGGSASAMADVTGYGTRLSGTYTSNDCLGTYSGSYNFSKQ